MRKTMMFGLLAIAALTISTMASASPIGGPKLVSDTIGQNMEEKFDVVLNADEDTLFTIQGDNRSDLDCYLYDENGGLVSKDDDATSLCILTVKPKWAGHFSLYIKNVGHSQSSFRGRIQ